MLSDRFQVASQYRTGKTPFTSKFYDIKKCSVKERIDNLKISFFLQAEKLEQVFNFWEENDHKIRSHGAGQMI